MAKDASTNTYDQYIWIDIIVVHGVLVYILKLIRKLNFKRSNLAIIKSALKSTSRATNMSLCVVRCIISEFV